VNQEGTSDALKLLLLISTKLSALIPVRSGSGPVNLLFSRWSSASLVRLLMLLGTVPLSWGLLSKRRTSSVLRSPNVGGMLPEKLLLSRSRCINFICEEKIWLGMGPDSWLIPKWKCFVFVRLSNPGFVPSNMGSSPVSLLSARSNQYNFERLPSDAGMEPENLLEFSDLQA